MRLLVVSHTRHYLDGDIVVGWAPTVREVDRLATLFERVVHVAPLHAGAPPASSRPYASTTTTLHPVTPSAGVRNLMYFPQYVRAVAEEARRADVVHVRFPASIALAALIPLSFRRHPDRRWFKYAGNWRPDAGEPWSYRLQRLLLAAGAGRAEVTVNGSWPDQPPHVHAFLNPCLTEEELTAGAEAARRKHLADPVRLLFVGRIQREKGPLRALQILERLHDLDAQLDVVGAGEDLALVEREVRSSAIGKRVLVHGSLPRERIDRLYAEAHFLLLPSASEGWPKVLSEGMAFGAVPLAAARGSIPHYLERFSTGRALDPFDLDAYAGAVRDYHADPERWKDDSKSAVAAARRFSYDEYLEAVSRLLELVSRRAIRTSPYFESAR